MPAPTYRIIHYGNNYYPQFMCRGNYICFENGFGQDLGFKTNKLAIDYVNVHIDKIIAAQTVVIKQARDKIRAARSSKLK